MNIVRSFKEAFERARSKKWDYIVVLVDIHGTIFQPCWDNEETFAYYPGATQALRIMSARKDIKMVLWSSCYPDKLEMYNNKLKEENIIFDYLNEFPEAENSSTGCFEQKMFFNVGIDNAFGFEADNFDWYSVIDALKIYSL